jgi:response regulator RpfG family c-di-GMP phosphodiesterase
MDAPLPRVLCIDDDRQLLEGLKRTLRQRFEIVTAGGGPAALQLLRSDTNFAVVVSDYRMPGADGIALLGQIRTILPDAARILLTGQADLKAAAAAVNVGNVFRFMLKPCPPDILIPALTAGVEYYTVKRNERDLLEKTLQGSMKAVTQMLSIVNPAAFGRSERAARLMTEMMAMIGLRDRWEAELAAMLSQIGCITIPPVVVEKIYHGRPLEPEERQMADRLPAAAARILADIPRLEEVRRILLHQADPFDESPVAPPGTDHGTPLPSRLLRTILDFDDLQSQGYDVKEAFSRMRARPRCYDPDILADLESITGTAAGRRLIEIPLKAVKIGMVFGDDVIMTDGTLLIARGQEVTPALADRIENFWTDVELRAPVMVIAQPETAEQGSAA